MATGIDRDAVLTRANELRAQIADAQLEHDAAETDEERGELAITLSELQYEERQMNAILDGVVTLTNKE